jgi:hypothetical protein
MDQYGKATVSGLAASLAMFIVMFIGIHVTGIAPFNVPPSAAFLETLGLNVGPVPLLVHFGYGAFWSVVLVAIVGSSANLKNGIGLAVGLWLVMMLALSPLIGWGVFGQSPSVTDPEATLYLQAGPKYVVMTFVLHLLYGGIIGSMNGYLLRE